MAFLNIFSEFKFQINIVVSSILVPCHQTRDSETLKSVAVDAEKFVQIRAFAFSRLKSSLLNDYINLTVEIKRPFLNRFMSLCFLPKTLKKEKPIQ